MLSKINIWLKAYALHYVLMIALVSAFVCSSLILIMGYTKNYKHQLAQNHTTNRDFQSNLAFSLGSYESLDRQGYIQIKDQQSATIKPWGVLDIISLEIELRDSIHSRHYLLGSDPTLPVNKAAIYLADKRKVLTVTGDTRIEGDVFVPNKTVKRGYVDGLNFKSDKLVYGIIEGSNKTIPPVQIKQIQKTLTSGIEVSYEELPTINNSFSKPPYIINWNGNYLSQVNLEGNFIVKADQVVSLAKDSHLKDIIIVAPSVTIENDFVGNLQIFATDTIIIEKGVQLNYPSVLSINGKQPYLRIDEDSEFHGAIDIRNNQPDFNKTSVYISKDVNLYGEMRVEGVVEFRGDLQGFLSCDQLVYSTASGKYQNYLVNAHISSSKLSKYYVHLLNHTGGNKKVLKQVY